MRTFFYWILLPATAALAGMAWLDRARGDGRLWRAVVIGLIGGLCGAIAYDIFRLPFVFSNAWGMGRIGIPQMPLFKVFPRFGALILGQPLEQGVPAGQPGSAWGAGYPLAAHLIGWLYHFSNGATFGVMFVTMYSGAKEACEGFKTRSWNPVCWATVMAVGIEICFLLSPYARFFDIQQTARFVVVTLLAHVVFGVFLGAYFAWHAGRWKLPATAFGGALVRDQPSPQIQRLE